MQPVSAARYVPYGFARANHLLGDCLPDILLDSRLPHRNVDTVAMTLDVERIKSWYVALTLAGFS
ncbi:MAG: hypothetical protein ACO24O_06645, partial [Arenimonas sp.]